MQQAKEKIISFPHMGDYWLPFKAIMDVLDCKIILPPPMTKKTLELGMKHSPEFVCIPFKYNLGNYIEALEKGANFLIQAGGGCRFGYYAEVQKTILDNLGYDYEFYQIVEDLNMLNIFKDFKRINPKLSNYKIIMAFLKAFKKLRVLDEIDFLTRKKIGFEKNDGDFENLRKRFLIELDKAKTFKEIGNVKKETLNEINNVQLEKPKHLLRVGIVGELYILMEPFSNFFIEKTLGKMGVEVYRHVTVSSILHECFFRKIHMDKIQKYAKPYLKYHIGAHGTESVGRTHDMVKKGFDGVIHLKPFGCLTADTEIIINNYDAKPIKDIKVGEKVLTHKGRFKKVLKTFSRKYNKKILNVDCGGLFKLNITPEHPVFSLKKEMVKPHKKLIENPNFNPISNLEEGDFIAIPKTNQFSQKNYYENPIKYRRKPKYKDIEKLYYNKDILRLIGYYLAEGNLGYDFLKKNKLKKYLTRVVFTLNKNERYIIDDIRKIINKNFEASINEYTYPKKSSTVSLIVCNRSFAHIIEKLCNRHCDKKELHPNLMLLEPKLQLEIAKGFFRGDGCLRDKYGETTYRAVTTSIKLANQLFWILIRNNIKSTIVEQNIKNRKRSYMIKISNAKGINRIKDDRIKVTKRIDNVRFIETRDYFFVPIKDIEEKNFNGKVYNLEVEEDSSYIANNLAVHNCMPEISAMPALYKIARTHKFPIIFFSFDSQTSETGLKTRLEAFYDMISMKKCK